MNIVHIISRDKFTEDYIEFMKVRFPQYEHVFITNSYSLKSTLSFMREVTPSRNIYFYHNPKIISYVTARETRSNRLWSILKTLKINGLWGRSSKFFNRVLEKSDFIIVSGLFGNVDDAMITWPDRILDKTYIHFWGGDFYDFRDDLFKLNHQHTIDVMDKAGGVIFLLMENMKNLNQSRVLRKVMIGCLLLLCHKVRYIRLITIHIRKICRMIKSGFLLEIRQVEQIGTWTY